MLLKEAVKDKLLLTEDHLKIKKSVVTPENFSIVQSILDLNVDAEELREKLVAVPLEERIKLWNSVHSRDEERDSEIESEVVVDAISIEKGDLLEVSALKVMNHFANKITEDSTYAVISLSTKIQTNDEVSLLELKEPVYHTPSEKMMAKQKVEDQNGRIVRNMNATSYNLSVILPMPNGSFDFNDIDGFNEILGALDGFKASYGRSINKYLSGKIGAEEVFSSQTAIKNKSKIRAYISSSLGDEMDDIEKSQRISQKVAAIWDTLGIKPMTQQTLDINFQVSKVRIAGPGSFSSRSRNVSIMKGREFDMKIERTKFSNQFKLPYCQEELKTEDLVALETLFTSWAENEVRACLDYELLPKVKVKDLSWKVKEIKVAEDLGIEEAKVKEIMTTISNKVDSAINFDKLKDL